MARFRTHPVHRDLKNRSYCRFREFLAQTEGWSQDQIETFQLQSLDRLVRTAVAKTPGYEKLYADNGVANIRIRDFADFRKLPFVDKTLLQKDVGQFSTAANPDNYVTTGGSTGIPFGFYRSQEAFSKELAAKAHQYYRVNWREGDRQVVFRGTPIDNPERYEFYPEYNELRLSSYHLTEKTLEQYFLLIESYNPHWIRCYPSSAQLLAQFLIDRGLKLSRLKGVLCASENLYQHQIDLFERAFSGKIFCHYGHYEQAVLAGFCETETTHHVLPQYGFAELIDSNNHPLFGEGQIGEIVGSSFIMDDTLFIRYRTQDYAIYGGASCHACGRPYQKWTRIEGRLQDWVIAADGRPVSMTAFNMHDTTFEALKQFQLVQSLAGEVTFKMVPKRPLTEKETQEILDSVRYRLGQGFNVRAAFETHIALTKRGKHRFLRQNLPLSFGDQGVQTLFEAK